MTQCTLAQPFTDASYAKSLADFWRGGHNSMRRTFSPASWLSADAPALVVDVGSYTGEDLKAFLNRSGTLARNVSIHTYEPVPAVSAKLVRAMAPYPQVIVHPFGLGDATYRACIQGVGDGARLVRKSGLSMRCNRRAEVVDVRRALSQFRRPVDLLQINCEGCEAAILRRLLARPMPLVIRSIEVQFHRVVDVNAYCHIERKLEEHGYRLQYRYPYVWERWDRT